MAIIDERRFSAHFDLPLFGAIIGLVLVGLATIYSVESHGGRPGPEFWTQVKALLIGLFAMLLCVAVDYRTLAQRSLILYGLLLAALVYVLLFGHISNGSRRWITLWRLSLQPSEFTRITVALVLAAFYGESRRRARSLGELAIGAAIVGIPAMLIYKQPDFGTPLALVPLYLGVIFVAGLPLRMLTVATVVAVVLSPVVYTYGLKPYQRERIITYLHPESDAHGKGYQQIQAKIAVGSGGLAGKGFGQGTQGGYGFLPVAHNDFVFSVLAEEEGFIGVLVALSLYLFVILRSLDAARLARDRLGAFLVVAIISGFSFQVVYNITMSAGMAPVKGLTLPLMSYGGTSLIATLAGFGLILNVRMRRFAN